MHTFRPFNFGFNDRMSLQINKSLYLKVSSGNFAVSATNLSFSIEFGF